MKEKRSNCTLVFKSRTGQGDEGFQVQIVNCVSLRSKRFGFDFYWIPITLTIRLYPNELFISRKWKWWFHFAYSVVLSLSFYGVQKRLASFWKDLIFISAKLLLLWLCRFTTTHYWLFRNQNWDSTVWFRYSISF